MNLEKSNKRKNQMQSINATRPRRRLVTGLIAALAAFCLLLVTTLGTLADTVNISDKAGVLNASQVQSEAAKLPYPVNIYTMNNFTGSESAFNQEAVRTLNDAHNSRLIIIAIDTRNKFLAIVGGKNVSTSSSVYNDAVNAFKNNFNGGDYTGATIASLQSLQSSLGGSTGSGVSNSAAGFSFLPLCLIGLLVLGLIVIAGMLFMRSARRRNPPYPIGNPYQQPYNQGYPPNYYGPGNYQQGSGMNPWAAGGLGAAAGGLIGYELGKHEGEEQGNEGGGDFGGGAGGTFGGDGGGDFGGGAGGTFGGDGGGDFGGGAGGDFGGSGGDFGGGGGSGF
jgi:hypothetical protein